jgi:hypothetical protein
MKPFVLLMILLHSPQRMTPAAQWFDTLAQCTESLADQATRVMRADDKAFIYPRNIDGEVIVFLTSKRFMAWCQESRSLGPDVLSELGKLLAGRLSLSSSRHSSLVPRGFAH